MEPDFLPAYLAGRAYLNYQVDRWLKREEILNKFDETLKRAYASEPIRSANYVLLTDDWHYYQ